MNPPLLLASGSPRRSELLTAAGIPFQTLVPQIAERADQYLSARELTTWNALRKALIVARSNPHRVVLAADTVVALEDEIIGKPADLDDAFMILRRLSGRVHHVHSSVFVGTLASGKTTLFSEVSAVQFKKLNDQEISSYFKKIDPLDKAGAYAAQGHGAMIIQSIAGSYSNVVGLPMERTLAVLKEFGIAPTGTFTPRSPLRQERRPTGWKVHGEERDTRTKR